MNIMQGYNWRMFVILMLLAFSAFAFQLLTGISELSENDYSRIATLETIIYVVVNVAGILFVTFTGLLAAQRTGFDIYKNDSFTIPAVMVPILIGSLLAVFAVGTDYLLFGRQIVDKVRSMGGIGSRTSVVYAAAVGEEILFRLFLMSVIVWIAGWKIRSVATSIWIAILLSSIFFGIAHFPKTADGLSIMIMVRAMLLSGIAGIVFGWMFWKRGLVSAMLVHFSADFVIYFILPAYLDLANAV